MWGYPLRSNNCGNEKSFVNIDATANRVNNLQSITSFEIRIVEEEDID